MATRKKGARKTSKKSARDDAAPPARRGRRAKDGAEMPDRIFAIASPRSVGGVSMFTPGLFATADNVANFASDPNDVQDSAQLLAEAGFEVLQATDMMINFAGTRAQFERAFGTTLYAEERPTMKSAGREELATFLDTVGNDVPGLIETRGTRFESVLEGVALETPRYYNAPSIFPPRKSYWHLNVPGDVSVGCNADRAHRGGTTGLGIRIAMVDSGFWKHPFFESRGYRVNAVTLGPGATNALRDEIGHGTGECANIFAVAPDIELFPVKTSNGLVLVNTTGAVNAAVALNPHIITNSWGSSRQFGPLPAADQALAAVIAAAWASGIIVVFSAGNGGWGFPGQHPDVISAGGVFMNPDGTMRASDYASGFMSNVYPGRRVPDLSGLVGMRPGAKYIMLPLEPGDDIDVGGSGGTHPNRDETASNDGWAAFSGTSAAAPQLAGAAALVKQACPRLTPAEVRSVLMSTARDVTTGTNHPNFGNAAVVGPDTATGNGLVDAHRAVLTAKLRCLVVPLIPFRPPLTPLIPTIPLTPVIPLIPFRPPLPPLTPVIPTRPLTPLIPLTPLRPLIPVLPTVPLRPLIPLRPFAPIGPGPGPIPAAQSDDTGPGFSADEIAELEKMIMERGDAL
jgi:subtilisin family serine protease